MAGGAVWRWQIGDEAVWRWQIGDEAVWRWQIGDEAVWCPCGCLAQSNTRQKATAVPGRRTELN